MEIQRPSTSLVNKKKKKVKNDVKEAPKDAQIVSKKELEQKIEAPKFVSEYDEEDTTQGVIPEQFQPLTVNPVVDPVVERLEPVQTYNLDNILTSKGTYSLVENDVSKLDEVSAYPKQQVSHHSEDEQVEFVTEQEEVETEALESRTIIAQENEEFELNDALSPSSLVILSEEIDVMECPEVIGAVLDNDSVNDQMQTTVDVADSIIADRIDFAQTTNTTHPALLTSPTAMLLNARVEAVEAFLSTESVQLLNCTRVPRSWHQNSDPSRADVACMELDFPSLGLDTCPLDLHIPTHALNQSVDSSKGTYKFAFPPTNSISSQHQISLSDPYITCSTKKYDGPILAACEDSIYNLNKANPTLKPIKQSTLDLFPSALCENIPIVANSRKWSRYIDHAASSDITNPPTVLKSILNMFHFACILQYTAADQFKLQHRLHAGTSRAVHLLHQQTLKLNSTMHLQNREDKQSDVHLMYTESHMNEEGVADFARITHTINEFSSTVLPTCVQYMKQAKYRLYDYILSILLEAKIITSADVDVEAESEQGSVLSMFVSPDTQATLAPSVVQAAAELQSTRAHGIIINTPSLSVRQRAAYVPSSKDEANSILFRDAYGEEDILIFGECPEHAVLAGQQQDIIPMLLELETVPMEQFTNVYVQDMHRNMMKREQAASSTPHSSNATPSNSTVWSSVGNVQNLTGEHTVQQLMGEVPLAPLPSVKHGVYQSAVDNALAQILGRPSFPAKTVDLLETRMAQLRALPSQDDVFSQSHFMEFKQALSHIREIVQKVICLIGTQDQLVQLALTGLVHGQPRIVPLQAFEAHNSYNVQFQRLFEKARNGYHVGAGEATVTAVSLADYGDLQIQSMYDSDEHIFAVKCDQMSGISPTKLFFLTRNSDKRAVPLNFPLTPSAQRKQLLLLALYLRICGGFSVDHVSSPLESPSLDALLASTEERDWEWEFMRNTSPPQPALVHCDPALAVEAIVGMGLPALIRSFFLDSWCTTFLHFLPSGELVQGVKKDQEPVSVESLLQASQVAFTVTLTLLKNISESCESHKLDVTMRKQLYLEYHNCVNAVVLHLVLMDQMMAVHEYKLHEIEGVPFFWCEKDVQDKQLAVQANTEYTFSNDSLADSASQFMTEVCLQIFSLSRHFEGVYIDQPFSVMSQDTKLRLFFRLFTLKQDAQLNIRTVGDWVAHQHSGVVYDAKLCRNDCLLQKIMDSQYGGKSLIQALHDLVLHEHIDSPPSSNTNHLASLNMPEYCASSSNYAAKYSVSQLQHPHTLLAEASSVELRAKGMFSSVDALSYHCQYACIHNLGVTCPSFAPSERHQSRLLLACIWLHELVKLTFVTERHQNAEYTRMLSQLITRYPFLLSQLLLSLHSLAPQLRNLSMDFLELAPWDNWQPCYRDLALLQAFFGSRSHTKAKVRLPSSVSDMQSSDHGMFPYIDEDSISPPLIPLTTTSQAVSDALTTIAHAFCINILDSCTTPHPFVDMVLRMRHVLLQEKKQNVSPIYASGDIESKVIAEPWQQPVDSTYRSIPSPLLPIPIDNSEKQTEDGIIRKFRFNVAASMPAGVTVGLDMRLWALHTLDCNNTLMLLSQQLPILEFIDEKWVLKFPNQYCMPISLPQMPIESAFIDLTEVPLVKAMCMHGTLLSISDIYASLVNVLCNYTRSNTKPVQYQLPTYPMYPCQLNNRMYSFYMSGLLMKVNYQENEQSSNYLSQFLLKFLQRSIYHEYTSQKLLLPPHCVGKNVLWSTALYITEKQFSTLYHVLFPLLDTESVGILHFHFPYLHSNVSNNPQVHGCVDIVQSQSTSLRVCASDTFSLVCLSSIAHIGLLDIVLPVLATGPDHTVLLCDTPDITDKTFTTIDTVTQQGTKYSYETPKYEHNAVLNASGLQYEQMIRAARRPGPARLQAVRAQCNISFHSLYEQKSPLNIVQLMGYYIHHSTPMRLVDNLCVDPSYLRKTVRTMFVLVSTQPYFLDSQLTSEGYSQEIVTNLHMSLQRQIIQSYTLLRPEYVNTAGSIVESLQSNLSYFGDQEPLLINGTTESLTRDLMVYRALSSCELACEAVRLANRDVNIIPQSIAVPYNLSGVLEHVYVCLMHLQTASLTVIDYRTQTSNTYSTLKQNQPEFQRAMQLRPFSGLYPIARTLSKTSNPSQYPSSWLYNNTTCSLANTICQSVCYLPTTTTQVHFQRLMLQFLTEQAKTVHTWIHAQAVPDIIASSQQATAGSIFVLYGPYMNDIPIREPILLPHPTSAPHLMQHYISQVFFFTGPFPLFCLHKMVPSHPYLAWFLLLTDIAREIPFWEPQYEALQFSAGHVFESLEDKYIQYLRTLHICNIHPQYVLGHFLPRILEFLHSLPKFHPLTKPAWTTFLSIYCADSAAKIVLSDFNSVFLLRTCVERQSKYTAERAHDLTLKTLYSVASCVAIDVTSNHYDANDSSTFLSTQLQDEETIQTLGDRLVESVLEQLSVLNPDDYACARDMLYRRSEELGQACIKLDPCLRRGLFSFAVDNDDDELDCTLLRYLTNPSNSSSGPALLCLAQQYTALDECGVVLDNALELNQNLHVLSPDQVLTHLYRKMEDKIAKSTVPQDIHKYASKQLYFTHPVYLAIERWRALPNLDAIHLFDITIAAILNDVLRDLDAADMLDRSSNVSTPQSLHKVNKQNVIMGKKVVHQAAVATPYISPAHPLYTEHVNHTNLPVTMQLVLSDRTALTSKQYQQPTLRPTVHSEYALDTAGVPVVLLHSKEHFVSQLPSLLLKLKGISRMHMLHQRDVARSLASLLNQYVLQYQNLLWVSSVVLISHQGSMAFTQVRHPLLHVSEHALFNISRLCCSLSLSVYMPSDEVLAASKTAIKVLENEYQVIVKKLKLQASAQEYVSTYTPSLAMYEIPPQALVEYNMRQLHLCKNVPLYNVNSLERVSSSDVQISHAGRFWQLFNSAMPIAHFVHSKKTVPLWLVATWLRIACIFVPQIQMQPDNGAVCNMYNAKDASASHLQFVRGAHGMRLSYVSTPNNTDTISVSIHPPKFAAALPRLRMNWNSASSLLDLYDYTLHPRASTVFTEVQSLVRPADPETFASVLTPYRQMAETDFSALIFKIEQQDPSISFLREYFMPSTEVDVTQVYSQPGLAKTNFKLLTWLQRNSHDELDIPLLVLTHKNTQCSILQENSYTLNNNEKNSYVTSIPAVKAAQLAIYNAAIPLHLPRLVDATHALLPRSSTVNMGVLLSSTMSCDIPLTPAALTLAKLSAKYQSSPAILQHLALCIALQFTPFDLCPGHYAFLTYGGHQQQFYSPVQQIMPYVSIPSYKSLLRINLENVSMTDEHVNTIIHTCLQFLNSLDTHSVQITQQSMPVEKGAQHLMRILCEPLEMTRHNVAVQIHTNELIKKCITECLQLITSTIESLLSNDKQQAASIDSNLHQVCVLIDKISYTVDAILTSLGIVDGSKHLIMRQCIEPFAQAILLYFHIQVISSLCCRIVQQCLSVCMNEDLFYFLLTFVLYKVMSWLSPQHGSIAHVPEIASFQQVQAPEYSLRFLQYTEFNDNQLFLFEPKQFNATWVKTILQVLTQHQKCHSTLGTRTISTITEVFGKTRANLRVFYNTTLFSDTSYFPILNAPIVTLQLLLHPVIESMNQLIQNAFLHPACNLPNSYLEQSFMLCSSFELGEVYEETAKWLHQASLLNLMLLSTPTLLDQYAITQGLSSTSFIAPERSIHVSSSLFNLVEQVVLSIVTKTDLCVHSWIVHILLPFALKLDSRLCEVLLLTVHKNSAVSHQLSTHFTTIGTVRSTLACIESLTRISSSSDLFISDSKLPACEYTAVDIVQRATGIQSTGLFPSQDSLLPLTWANTADTHSIQLTLFSSGAQTLLKRRTVVYILQESLLTTNQSVQAADANCGEMLQAVLQLYTCFHEIHSVNASVAISDKLLYLLAAKSSLSPSSVKARSIPLVCKEVMDHVQGHWGNVTTWNTSEITSRLLVQLKLPMFNFRPQVDSFDQISALISDYSVVETPFLDLIHALQSSVKSTDSILSSKQLRSNYNLTLKDLTPQLLALRMVLAIVDHPAGDTVYSNPLNKLVAYIHSFILHSTLTKVSLHHLNTLMMQHNTLPACVTIQGVCITLPNVSLANATTLLNVLIERIHASYALLTALGLSSLTHCTSTTALDGLFCDLEQSNTYITTLTYIITFIECSLQRIILSTICACIDSIGCSRLPGVVVTSKHVPYNETQMAYYLQCQKFASTLFTKCILFTPMIVQQLLIASNPNKFAFLYQQRKGSEVECVSSAQHALQSEGNVDQSPVLQSSLRTPLNPTPAIVHSQPPDTICTYVTNTLEMVLLSWRLSVLRSNDDKIVCSGDALLSCGDITSDDVAIYAIASSKEGKQTLLRTLLGATTSSTVENLFPSYIVYTAKLYSMYLVCPLFQYILSLPTLWIHCLQAYTYPVELSLLLAQFALPQSYTREPSTFTFGQNVLTVYKHRPLYVLQGQFEHEVHFAQINVFKKLRMTGQCDTVTRLVTDSFRYHSLSASEGHIVKEGLAYIKNALHRLNESLQAMNLELMKPGDGQYYLDIGLQFNYEKSTYAQQQPCPPGNAQRALLLSTISTTSSSMSKATVLPELSFTQYKIVPLLVYLLHLHAQLRTGKLLLCPVSIISNEGTYINEQFKSKHLLVTQDYENRHYGVEIHNISAPLLLGSACILCQPMYSYLELFLKSLFNNIEVKRKSNGVKCFLKIASHVYFAPIRVISSVSLLSQQLADELAKPNNTKVSNKTVDKIKNLVHNSRDKLQSSLGVDRKCSHFLNAIASSDFTPYLCIDALVCDIAIQHSSKKNK